MKQNWNNAVVGTFMAATVALTGADALATGGHGHQGGRPDVNVNNGGRGGNQDQGQHQGQGQDQNLIVGDGALSPRANANANANASAENNLTDNSRTQTVSGSEANGNQVNSSPTASGNKVDNNPQFNTHNHNRSMFFTATQGVNAAVIAAASACNEINNKGFAANAGYMFAFLGLAASEGHHQIADERCQMVAMAMQNMLIDAERKHQLEFLGQQLQHDLLVKVIEAYSRSSEEDKAAGILAVASKVLALEIGYTTMFAAQERAQANSSTGTVGRLAILKEAFRREKVEDGEGNVIGTESSLNKFTQESFESWKRRNPVVKQEEFRIPTIVSGHGDNAIEVIVGDRKGDADRYKEAQKAREAAKTAPTGEAPSAQP